MASVSRDPGGRKRILFIGADNKRRAVRLGKVPQRLAESVCCYVESLAGSARARTPWEPETAAWVGKLEAALYDKLAAVGLVPRREPIPKTDELTLGAFLNSYITGRTDIKPRTVTALRQVAGWLTEYFGPARPLGSISQGDGDEWRLWLLQRLGENSVRRHCGRAKQFFRAAQRKRLIAESPFADMKGCSIKSNRSRDYFLSRVDAGKVLDACPDTQWRLLFALSRYAGLRCPSEHLLLTWQDVDWEHNRLTIHSPKTEHHDGKDSRIIPLFPELRVYLEQAFDEAEPGTQYVITRYRNTNANLRTQLNRIINRAGLKPWPKLFQNLRATRETELAADYPAHVVAAWMGHSVLVANKHYLQVTDTDFERAARGGAKCGALLAESAAQNPAQPISAVSRQGLPRNSNTSGGLDLRPTLADRGGYSHFGGVAGAGIEPARP